MKKEIHIPLPASFLNKMEASIGEDLTTFIQEMESSPPISIRLNSKKLKKWEENLDKVKWNLDKGIYLKVRPSFTLDPLFHAGAYYVQEASSMYLEYVLSQLFPTMEDLKILDLCAAPGGKSTLLADAVSDESFLLSNEVIHSRYKVLKENITKWGYINTHLSNHDSSDLKKLCGFFDIVLVDAPCSGEGLFRKDLRARQEWSAKHVEFCSSRQKRIINNAQELIKPGGYMIYSTCTYNNIENDLNVKWLVDSFNYEIKTIHTPKDWNITSTEFGKQFYPHKVRGEGFYIACLKKVGKFQEKRRIKNNSFRALKKLANKDAEKLKPWLATPEKYALFHTPKMKIRAILKSHISDCQFLDSILFKKEFGLEIGSFKGDHFIPSHALALSTIVNPNYPHLDLSLKEALKFLKKEAFSCKNDLQGFILVRYKGQNLGWIKVFSNRFNNYLPKEYRIRMELPK